MPVRITCACGRIFKSSGGFLRHLYQRNRLLQFSGRAAHFERKVHIKGLRRRKVPA